MKANNILLAITATLLLVTSIFVSFTNAKNPTIEKLLTDIAGYKIRNNPPQIYLLYPPPDEKVSHAAELIWFAIDRDNDKLYFRVYIGETPEEMKFIGKTTRNTFKISLQPGKEYFWMIEAFDGKEYVKSPVRRFSTEEIERQEPTYNWTYILYIDGDNNLYPYALSELNEISNSSIKDTAVIALLDGNGENDTLLYIVGKEKQKMFLNEKNMGSPETLEELVEYAKKNYAAKNYILELWGHGNGWMGICFDETDKDMLTMPEIENALEKAGGVDIIIFSACYMGCVEVAYNLKNVANYMVACEGAMPAGSLPHNKILETINMLGAENACREIVNIYGEHASLSTSFAVWNLSRISLLLGAINEFVKSPAINVVEARNESSYCLQYIDLEKFAEILGGDEVIEAINETIISSCGTLHGVGIYFPVKGQSSKYYSDTKFSSASLWDEFISSYV